MSRSYSKTALTTSNVVYGRDITIGYATLKTELRKGVMGWALPGFGFTANADTAEQITLRMHDMIAAKGGLPVTWMNKQKTLPAVTLQEVTDEFVL